MELGLYLATAYNREDLEDLGLGDVTSTRVSRNGHKPGITTAEILERGPMVIPKFRAPAMAPTLDQVQGRLTILTQNWRLCTWYRLVRF